MKIKITRDTAIKGTHCSAGSVVETDDRTARQLIAMDKALEVAPAKKKPAPTQKAPGKKSSAKAK